MSIAEIQAEIRKLMAPDRPEDRAEWFATTRQATYDAARSTTAGRNTVAIYELNVEAQIIKEARINA